MSNANLIFAPNTTQVPNVIFDYWMGRLSPAEFKVLLCICRKTFGWHKMRDSISLSQIEKATGLSHFGVVKIINSLIDLKLIIKVNTKNSDNSYETNQYEINVLCLNPEQDSPNPGPNTSSNNKQKIEKTDSVVVNSVGEGSQLSWGGVVNSVDPSTVGGVVNSVATQKKTYTKHTYIKSISYKGGVQRGKDSWVSDSDFSANAECSADAERKRSPSSFSKKEKQFPEDSKPMQLAKRLLAVVQQSNPHVQKVKLQKWANTIDLMIRVDNSPIALIEEALDKLPSDEFWSTTILSAEGLRKNLYTFISKSRRKPLTYTRKDSQERKGFSKSDLARGVIADEDISMVISQTMFDLLVSKGLDTTGYIVEKKNENS